MVRLDVVQLPDRIGIYLCTDRCRTLLQEFMFVIFSQVHKTSAYWLVWKYVQIENLILTCMCYIVGTRKGLSAPMADRPQL